MDYFKKIEEIAENQNGILLSSDLDENGIPRAYLSMMVAKGDLEKVGRGILENTKTYGLLKHNITNRKRVFA